MRYIPLLFFFVAFHLAWEAYCQSVTAGNVYTPVHLKKAGKEAGVMPKGTWGDANKKLTNKSTDSTKSVSFKAVFEKEKWSNTDPKIKEPYRMWIWKDVNGEKKYFAQRAGNQVVDYDKNKPALYFPEWAAFTFRDKGGWINDTCNHTDYNCWHILVNNCILQDHIQNSYTYHYVYTLENKILVDAKWCNNITCIPKELFSKSTRHKHINP